MSLRDEIFNKLEEIESKVSQNKTITPEELDFLFVTSLLEEEGK